MFSLEGKTALVAGASRGIGLAIAKGMAEAGAHTIFAARSVDALEAEASALEWGRSAGQRVAGLILPTRLPFAKPALTEVDILVNVAGTNVRRAFEEYSAEEYQHIHADQSARHRAS